MINNIQSLIEQFERQTDILEHKHKNYVEIEYSISTGNGLVVGVLVKHSKKEIELIKQKDKSYLEFLDKRILSFAFNEITKNLSNFGFSIKFKQIKEVY